MGSIIQVNNLRKVFVKKGRKPHVVIDGLSMNIEKDTFVSIIGPSGCGKTTLLRILAGLIPYESGEVVIGGKKVVGPSIDRAMVFQGFNLLPWRSVIKNVEFGLEASARKIGAQERLERANKAIELVGLKGFERYYPHEISGGMQQRAGLARALATDPDILFMDEPFASVDAQTREDLQDELLKVRAKVSNTVVFITHSIDEAIYLSDRVIVLSTVPTHVRDDLPIPIKHPRWEYDVKSSTMFGELRTKLRQGLTQTVKKESQSRVFS